MKGKKKQIYVPTEDFDILDYWEGQPNQSQYIIRLVRADMQGQEKLTKADVIKLIEQYTKNTEVNSDVKDSIKNLLGW